MARPDQHTHSERTSHASSHAGSSPNPDAPEPVEVEPDDLNHGRRDEARRSRQALGEHPYDDDDPKVEGSGHRERRAFEVLRQRIDERRELVEEEVRRRGRARCSPFGRQQLVEAVEGRRGDADVAPWRHSSLVELSAFDSLAAVAPRSRRDETSAPPRRSRTTGWTRAPGGPAGQRRRSQAR